jgi:acyl-homoserine-lactone acylase
MVFNDRNYGGELVRDDLVALCAANPSVRLADGADVDLRPACRALSRWNLRDELDSVGVHVFRELMLRKPRDWLAVPFDPRDPVNTPHTLDRSKPEVLQPLGEAVRQLEAPASRWTWPWDRSSQSRAGTNVSPFTAATKQRGSST